MTHLFVYGTLKRNGRNHHFLDGQTYRGDARTIGGYTLYLVADYPGMVRSANPAHSVTGEVWLVDANALAELDALEGTNEGLYVREPVALQAPYVGPLVHTYLYLRSIQSTPHLGDIWPVSAT